MSLCVLGQRVEIMHNSHACSFLAVCVSFSGEVCMCVCVCVGFGSVSMVGLTDLSHTTRLVSIHFPSETRSSLI